MTRARTRIRRHVLSRQRLTCRILRRWKKHVLAVEETCCVMFSLQSRRTPRSRTTSVKYCIEGQDKDALLYCHPLWFGGQTKSVLFLWHLVSNAWTHTRIGCDGCMLPFSL